MDIADDPLRNLHTRASYRIKIENQNFCLGILRYGSLFLLAFRYVYGLNYLDLVIRTRLKQKQVGTHTIVHRRKIVKP